MIVAGKQMQCILNGEVYHCAMDVAMSYIGGKWKTVVLWYLLDGPKRFSELKRAIPDITEKMLSLQLKKMEKDGILTRKIYAEVPPRVEYFLTKEGKTLIPMIKEIADWGKYMGKKYGEIIEVKKEEKKKVKPL
ncbi:MAG: helix-turn-helix transcriptional regulator [Bacteroidetes bacterium]|nr:helix-turn-helix transcriptional regulator [Bacteroidota bacterium]